MRSTPHQKPKVSVTVPGDRFILLFYLMGAFPLGKTFHQVHPMSLLPTPTHDRSVSFSSSLWACLLGHSSLLFKVTPSHMSPRHSTIMVTVRSSLCTANTHKMLRTLHLISQHSKFKSSVHNSPRDNFLRGEMCPLWYLSNVGHPGRRHGQEGGRHLVRTSEHRKIFFSSPIIKTCWRCHKWTMWSIYLHTCFYV